MSFKADLLHGVNFAGGLEVGVEVLLDSETSFINQELRNLVGWMGDFLGFWSDYPWVGAGVGTSAAGAMSDLKVEFCKDVLVMKQWV